MPAEPRETVAPPQAPQVSTDLSIMLLIAGPSGTTGPKSIGGDFFGTSPFAET
jgi:hypothetical protein